MSEQGTDAVRRWAEANSGLFEINTDSVVATIDEWRNAVMESAGITGVEVAGPLQRHLMARGTGMPGNFCLAVTANEVIAFKLNPKNAHHPWSVGAKQIKNRVESWPRGSVRLTDIETGKLSYGVTLVIDGSAPIPCRTPRFNGSAAATMLIMTLGGEFTKR